MKQQQKQQEPAQPQSTAAAADAATSSTAAAAVSSTRGAESPREEFQSVFNKEPTSAASSPSFFIDRQLKMELAGSRPNAANPFGIANPFTSSIGKAHVEPFRQCRPCRCKSIRKR